MTQGTPAKLAPRRLAATPTPEQGYGLSPQQATRSRRRLGDVAFLLAATAAVGAVAAPALPARFGASWATVGWVALFNGAGVLANLGLWHITRNRRWPDTLVLDLGLLWQVLGVFALHLQMDFVLHAALGRLPVATPTILWIALQPVIVPTPLRRTAVASFSAALTSPLAVALLYAAGAIEVSGPEFMDSLFVPGLAAGAAVYSSGVVHRLALDASRAERLGSYRLEEPLGEGGMGEVWRATHGMLARPAALKLIRPAMLQGGAVEPGALLSQFEAEARATAALRSPHTVEVYDFGAADDGRFYYVMELLDGFDLRTLVHEFGPLPPERVVHVLRQVCHSLGEAHDAGLVHRDIKPANLMLCRHGPDLDFLKVLDFGLVGRAGAHAGGTLGTPAYMAPEAAQGRGEQAADIYAMGCVGWMLLVGRPPFSGSSASQLLNAHMHEATQAPSLHAPTPVPAELDALLLACLAKDPAQRPASAGEFAARLAAVPVEAEWTGDRQSRWWDGAEPTGPGPNGPSTAQLADTVAVANA